MTFLEAAIEILRNAQGPLHFSEIARQAVDRGLLSHVGRDPEATMRSSLNAAVRGNNDPILVRAKPGHYAIRPGAELPEPPEPKAKPKAKPPVDEDEEERTAKPKRKTTRSRRRKPAPEPEPEVEEEEPEEAEEDEAEETEAEETEAEETEVEAEESEDEEADADESEDEEADADEDEDEVDEDESDEAESDEDEPDQGSKRGRSKRKRRRRNTGNRYGVRGEAPAPAVVAVKPSRRGADPAKRNEVLQKVQNLEFEAPQGSGLDGVTDVAVVMANAMSRLVEERPELRGELELIQQRAQAERQAQGPAVAAKGGRRAREREREREREEDDRGGRRRRRRRRRSKRIEWSQAGGDARQRSDDPTAALLLQAAKVLEGAGARSLHIRQLAEQLAQQNVLGGEISEIERAVSAAILTDVHRNGRSSRFVARGDARYQLQGTRLPGAAAIAEDALRVAAQAVSAETDRQLLQWVHSLGQRGLEALVRMYLAEEEYELKASLPPGKGVGKLVAIDPDPEDEDPRVLVVVAPRKAALDPSVWGPDLERNNIASALVFTMSDEVGDWDDARVIQGPELARWLRDNGVGIQKAKIEVPVLDPTLIESISGLDT